MVGYKVGAIVECKVTLESMVGYKVESMVGYKVGSIVGYKVGSIVGTIGGIELQVSWKSQHQMMKLFFNRFNRWDCTYAQ